MQRSIGTIVTLAVTGLLGLAACQPTVPTTPTVPSDPTTTTTTTAPPTTTTVPPANNGWRLVGGDEFNDTTLDGSKWKAYNNTYGDGNKELACLTPGNVAEGAGTLKIVARQEAITCPGNKPRSYSSGFLGSREVGKLYPMFGRYEMRAKLPHGQGLWPAFWLRHVNGAGVAEVDIMEYFHALRPGKTTGTLHLDGRHNLTQRNVDFENPAATPGWHTWAVEISPAGNDVAFAFYLDGNLYHSYTDTQHNWATSDPNATWDIAVNMAVGGSWTGDPTDALGYLRDLNKCSIGGTAPSGCVSNGIQRVNFNASPTYEVDYVRVYTH